ncbi:MAG: dolichyl-phosphate-mannose--protein mannosyltransferase, partial [Pseudomonadota bacterium]|nr:dolichyl-phosphate-mannose--protein mannosyltransferase [Pseudomonadota bacterium]
VVACYLIAAFWFAPKADVRQSFVPVISQIQAMQAQGKEVVLYQANERIAGAGVFYMQGYLTILQTPEELKSYLATKPGNVALVDNTDRLNVPVRVVKEMAINRQPYYFVEQ